MNEYSHIAIIQKQETRKMWKMSVIPFILVFHSRQHQQVAPKIQILRYWW